MSQVYIDELAKNDLIQIAEYIGVQRHSPVAANRLLDEFQRKFELYATQPRSGQLRPDLGADIRVFTHDNYVVVYRPLDHGIAVLRVFHAARDFPRLFADGS
jgi:toxin ParE1/3/4